MNNTSEIKQYLENVAEMCQANDIAAIAIAGSVGAENIRLKDVFVHMPEISGQRYFRSSRDDEALDEYIDPLWEKTAEDLADEAEEYWNNYEPSEEDIAEMQAEEEEYEEEPLPPDWKLFYGAPGSGKTALLKMYAFAYAYRYYTAKYGKNEDVFGDDASNEDICDKLGVTEGAIPVFIGIKDIKEGFPGMASKEVFEKAIADSISLATLGEINSKEAEALRQCILRDRVVFLVDDLEIPVGEGFEKDILSEIEARTFGGGKCYITADISERAHLTLGMPGADCISEYVLPDLAEKEENKTGADKNALGAVAEKVRTILNDMTGSHMDITLVERLLSSDDAADLITTPFEITALIMILINQYSARYRITDVYRQLLEAKIDWKNGDYLDIMRLLSQIAYKMTSSEQDPYYISYHELFELIKEIRTGEQARRRIKPGTDDSDIDEFIASLCANGILKKQKKTYRFSNRIYQEYLTAYCIRKYCFSDPEKTRMEYADELITSHNPKWGRVLIHLACDDNELRDGIFSRLLDLAGQRDDRPLAFFCLSVLTSLATFPNERFSYDRGMTEDELKMYFEGITYDTESLHPFELKYDSYKQMIVNRGNRVSEIFVNAVAERMESLSEEELKKYRSKLSGKVLYFLLNCESSEECISLALEKIYKHTFSLSMAETFYDTGKDSPVREKLLKVIGDEIESGQGSNIFIWVLYGLIAGGAYPGDSVVRLINKGDRMSKIGACGILFLYTILNRLAKERPVYTQSVKKIGYEHVEGELAKFAEFLKKGASDTEDKVLNDYFRHTLRGIYALGERIGFEDIWADKEAFGIQ